VILYTLFHPSLRRQAEAEDAEDAEDAGVGDAPDGDPAATAVGGRR